MSAKIVVKMKKAKNMIFVFFLLKKMLRGAERICWTKWSVAERGECKWRGRGLGQRNINCQKFKKKAWSVAKAPSHEKHFAPLDVRGLWHARPLPSILLFTSHGLRPRKNAFHAAKHKYLFFVIE